MCAKRNLFPNEFKCFSLSSLILFLVILSRCQETVQETAFLMVEISIKMLFTSIACNNLQLYIIHCVLHNEINLNDIKEYTNDRDQCWFACSMIIREVKFQVNFISPINIHFRALNSNEIRQKENSDDVNEVKVNNPWLGHLIYIERLQFKTKIYESVPLDSLLMFSLEKKKRIGCFSFDTSNLGEFYEIHMQKKSFRITWIR